MQIKHSAILFKQSNVLAFCYDVTISEGSYLKFSCQEYADERISLENIDINDEEDEDKTSTDLVSCSLRAIVKRIFKGT